MGGRLGKQCCFVAGSTRVLQPYMSSARLQTCCGSEFHLRGGVAAPAMCMES